jgi:hypothetical protein
MIDLFTVEGAYLRYIGRHIGVDMNEQYDISGHIVF